MQSNAIKRINQMGTAGVVISWILIALMIVGLVASAFAAVVLNLLPRDFLVIEAQADAAISVNFPEGWDMDVQQELMQDYSNFQFSIDAGLSGEVNMDMEKIETTPRGFRMLGSGTIANMTLETVRSLLTGAIFHMALSILLMVFVLRLCKAFKNCITPFCQEVITKMQQTAYAVGIWVILDAVGTAFAGWIFSGGKSGFDVNINLNTVLVAALIIGLVVVFKYGAALQQESDETL